MKEIPKAIIERDKEGVESLTYYGVPVAELDRDGLLAALNQSVKQSRLSWESLKSYQEFQALIRERERADYGLIGARR